MSNENVLIDINGEAVNYFFNNHKLDLNRIVDFKNPMAATADNCKIFVSHVLDFSCMDFNSKGYIHVWSEYAAENADSKIGHLMTFDAIKIIDDCARDAHHEVRTLGREASNQIEVLKIVKQKLLEVIARIDDAQGIYDKA